MSQYHEIIVYGVKHKIKQMKTRKIPVVLKETFDAKVIVELIAPKKAKKPNEPILDANGKTVGQLFKERWGFSKTFKRNMQKAGLNPFEEEARSIYRKQRNLLK